MSKTFDFDPDLWFRNKALRGCSPAARGLWIDLLALMHPTGGYLTINGKPIDDAQLSRLIGEPVKSIRAWIKELGEAGVFSVAGDSMCSSRMVKKAQFVAAAKKHGQAGQKHKREIRGIDERARAAGYEPVGDTLSLDSTPNAKIERTAARREITPESANAARAKTGMVAGPGVATPPPAVSKPAPAKKPLAWWKSPAGWVRHGASQAMSMQTDEAFEDYQCRLAARIPPGVHLDVLSPSQQRQVEVMRPKDPSGQVPQ